MITVTWLAVTGSLCKGNGGREGRRERGTEGASFVGFGGFSLCSWPRVPYVNSNT